jgi:hypothetical protein
MCFCLIQVSIPCPLWKFANDRSESYLSPFSELSRKMRSTTIRIVRITSYHSSAIEHGIGGNRLGCCDAL